MYVYASASVCIHMSVYVFVCICDWDKQTGTTAKTKWSCSTVCSVCDRYERYLTNCRNLGHRDHCFQKLEHGPLRQRAMETGWTIMLVQDEESKLWGNLFRPPPGIGGPAGSDAQIQVQQNKMKCVLEKNFTSHGFHSVSLLSSFWLQPQEGRTMLRREGKEVSYWWNVSDTEAVMKLKCTVWAASLHS